MTLFVLARRSAWCVNRKQVEKWLNAGDAESLVLINKLKQITGLEELNLANEI